MFNSLKEDSYWSGMLLGLFPLALAYYTLINYETIMQDTGVLKTRLQPPALQFVILGLTVLLFRFMMVKWDREKTGTGLLATVFTATLVYFITMRHSFLK